MSRLMRRLLPKAFVRPAAEESSAQPGAARTAKENLPAADDEMLAALRESEERYRIVAETASDAIITIDAESRILFVNRAAEKIFGYRIEEMSGQKLTMLMPEYLRHLHRAGIKRYIETGHKHISWQAVELPGLHSSGREIALELSFGEVTRDGQHFFTGIARDITRRKQTEQRQRAQYAVTRALAESATVQEAAQSILQHICEHLNWEMGALWNLDRAANLLRCVEIWQAPAAAAPEFAALTRSHAFRRGTGLPGRVWANRAPAWIPDVADDENFPRKAVALKEDLRSAFGFPVLLGGEMLGVMEFFSRQAQSPDAALLEMMTAMGNQIGQFIERKRAEEELRASEERYRYLTDAMPQIIWTARADGYFDYYNHRWFEYTGMTLEQTQGWGWQPVLHPEDAESCLRRWAKSIMTGESYEIEHRFRRAADGQYRWHLGRAVPLRDETGQIIKWFGTATDIDDQKRAQQAAQEANRAKDNFLATLSHELRAPLTPVIGWLHMLRTGIVPLNEAERWLAIVDKNAHTLMRLINDLLDMSAIMSGKMHVEQKPMPLAAALREAVETTRPEADNRHIEIVLSGCDDDEALVSGDRTRLVQVFVNLLNNAIKFSPDNSTVRLSCAAQDDFQSVVVEDEGEGIRPDFLPHVFEQFRQADESKTRTHGGLGIGLALVKSFVEAHGGSVRAESEGPGRGSRFTVDLPLLAAKSTAPASTTAKAGGAEASLAAPTRILIIEDTEDTLSLLQTSLRVRGYHTAPCQSAAEALRVAADASFDLIISDIGLPQMDGYALLARLREMPHLRNVPAIALTGYASQRDEEAALAAGYNTHLAKPIEHAELIAAIERLVTKRGRKGEGEKV